MSPEARRLLWGAIAATLRDDAEGADLLLGWLADEADPREVAAVLVRVLASAMCFASDREVWLPLLAEAALEDAAR